MVVICWVSFFVNGFLFFINIYFLLLYGSKVFYLFVIFDNIVNLLVCFVVFFFFVKFFRVLMGIMILGMVFFVYFLVLVGMSFDFFFVGFIGGLFLMVCIKLLFYSKKNIILVLI